MLLCWFPGVAVVSCFLRGLPGLLVVVVVVEGKKGSCCPESKTVSMLLFKDRSRHLRLTLLLVEQPFWQRKSNDLARPQSRLALGMCLR